MKRKSSRSGYGAAEQIGAIRGVMSPTALHRHGNDPVKIPPIGASIGVTGGLRPLRHPRARRAYGTLSDGSLGTLRVGRPVSPLTSRVSVGYAARRLMTITVG